MVSACVSWNGKTQIRFLEGARVPAQRYVTLLEESLLPDIQALYPNDDFILQQDGATCNTSHVTAELLEDNQITYIKKDC